MKQQFQVRCGTWQELGADASAIRHEVFVKEQNIPAELEWDERDALCLHAVAYHGSGQALATGRLLPDAHIGRMAVLASARGSGVGAAILASLIAAADARGETTLRLHAQVDAAGFYAKAGFEIEGGSYYEAGIEHVTMVKHLKQVE